jgi:quinone-modifying oxidoreductase, subunit QmoB
VEGKLGVYICTGYGIGEALDIDALKKVAESEYNADLVELVDNCEADGIEAINKSIADNEIKNVVVAGPTFRHYEKTAFPKDVVVDYANIREQVVWCQPPNDEDTQMMAEDYIRMAITKAKLMEVPEPFEGHADINKDILVVGGGVAGLTAALECAKTGYKVYLVEKEAELGGFAKKLYKSIPHKAPYENVEDTGVEELVSAVNDDENIEVILGGKINKIGGAPGMFDVEVEGRDGFTAGSIIQATGWKPAEPEHLAHLGYKSIPDVISNVQMEEMAKAGKIVRPSDGQPVSSVLFVQDEGSPEPDQFSYSSSINSLNAIKQAGYVREKNPNAKSYVIYDHFKAPGHNELYYKAAQQDAGIFMTKGVVESVENGGGSLKAKVNNTLLGEDIEIDVDMVVLGTGMVPVAADGEMIRIVVDAKATIEKGEAGAALELAKENLEKYKDEYEGTEILNLDYRQGPDLPSHTMGYPDSHFICFPYETRRTGIFTCGCVRAPMDIQGAMEDGTGAALKAIQCVEVTSRGEAVHPRSGDQSYPDFFLQRCTQCKRCTEECPFGVLNEDVKGTPLPNPTRCRRCGVCLGACPERIVSFKDYSVGMIADVIKNIEVPDEFDEKPRVLILACENDAYPAIDQLGVLGETYSAHVRVIPVRCLGSVNIVWINEALSKGHDGIILFGCKWGDDYQCHFVKGSEMMETRSSNVKEKLQTMALEEERLVLEQIEITDAMKVKGIIDEFMETIENIGMNPFKGM